MRIWVIRHASSCGGRRGKDRTTHSLNRTTVRECSQRGNGPKSSSGPGMGGELTANRTLTAIPLIALVAMTTPGFAEAPYPVSCPPKVSPGAMLVLGTWTG